jgi:hypothetical protein
MVVDQKMVGFDGQPLEPGIQAALGRQGGQQEKDADSKKDEIFQDISPKWTLDNQRRS